jgi:hypothetical protein
MRPKCLTAVAVLLLVCLTACAKRSPSVALPPAPPPPVTRPAPVFPLEQADAAFNSGNYEEAARGYESFLRAPSSDASNGPRDQALFRLGLTFVMRPVPDWQRAASLFKQVADDYPNSPLKPAASLILSLRSEVDKVAADAQQRDQRIRQLTSELDRLKKIDADRRKRP